MSPLTWACIYLAVTFLIGFWSGRIYERKYEHTESLGLEEYR